MLSTTRIAPTRCASSATAAISMTCKSGFVGVSIQTILVACERSRGESLSTGIFGVARHEPPRFEYALQEAKGSSVEIGGRDHFVARAQDREHGRGRRQPRCERQATLAVFERGQAGLERGPRRISAARILIALVPARAPPA